MAKSPSSKRVRLAQADVERLKALPIEDLLDVVEAVDRGARSVAEAIGLEPGFLNNLEHTALTHYRVKDYAFAAALYAYVLQLEPRRASAWRGLGAVCHAQQVYYPAVRCYQRAAELDAADLASRLFWAECLLACGETENALKLLGDIVEHGYESPAYAAYWVRAKGLLLARGGQPTRIELLAEGAPPAAEAAARLADSGVSFDATRELEWKDLERDPRLRAAVEELRVALVEGRLTLAQVGGFTAKELDGGYACACQYVETGEVLRAMQIAGYLMLLDPYDARYYQLVGICLHRMKQYTNADYYYRVALHLAPDDPMTLIYRGEARILAGQVDEGLMLLRKGRKHAGAAAEHEAIKKRADVLLKRYAP